MAKPNLNLKFYMQDTIREKKEHGRQIQTKLKESVGPGGQADAGGIVGSYEVPPQSLQEAEGHGRWALT